MIEPDGGHTVGGSTTLTDEPEPVGRIVVAHGTELGCVRTENQDSTWAVTAGDRAVLAVADGMGGHTGGASASQAATQILETAFEARGLDYQQDMDDLFQKVAESVAAAAPSGGTTLVVALITQWQLDVWHVGDSRAYVLRDSALMPVTTDHSWVQTLVDSGQITRQQAAEHPRRNVLLRAIGKDRNSTPEHSKLRYLPGDVVLLCSDGLHGVVPETEIGRILGAAAEPAAIAGALVQAAIDRGAPDNIGVAVAVYECDHQPTSA